MLGRRAGRVTEASGYHQPRLSAVGTAASSSSAGLCLLAVYTACLREESSQLKNPPSQVPPKNGKTSLYSRGWLRPGKGCERAPLSRMSPFPTFSTSAFTETWALSLPESLRSLLQAQSCHPRAPVCSVLCTLLGLSLHTEATQLSHQKKAQAQTDVCSKGFNPASAMASRTITAPAQGL